MDAEELKVVLRRNEHSGFGFSLLGAAGPPHVIYEIHENSPAAECEVEAGDIILKVNGTDVHRYTTKEVLKCLRLSDDLVTLELRRDPKLKARIKEQIANTNNPHNRNTDSPHIYDYKSSSCTSPNSHHRNFPSQDSYEPHNSNVNSNSPAGDPSTTSIRYAKSPTQLPHRQSCSTAQGNHSRNSSASSAKIQIADTAGTACASTATSSCCATNIPSTSPTCRPSRIPTALKCPQKAQVQHSPQHKRPRPSQIPTKGGSAATNGNSAANPPPLTSNSNSTATGTNLQHSNSYSGSSRFQQQSEEAEPNSAPPQPAKAPRFEAYMMTGELILNLSRTSQSSNLLPGPAKKIDSLRDSPQRSGNVPRANGALAPRASGESSPTSSSSVDSPTHTASSDSAHIQKNKHKRGNQQPHHILLQHQLDSINNSYNNSNSGGAGGGGDGHRKDDTLLLCEELERDDDNDFDVVGEGDNKCRQRQYEREQQRQQSQEQRYHHSHHHRSSYEHEEGEIEENEEDQTNYDITNIETYNSGGEICGDDESSDRQCLVMHYGDEECDADDDGILENEDYTNSLTSASAKNRLRALKQKAAATHQKNALGARGSGLDSVDCARQYYASHYRHQHQHQRQHGSGGSSTSSATVKSDGMAGVNTSPDETSFSVPTSPISLSTPLIDKDTANSVPTSPEPSSMGAVGGCGGVAGVHDAAVIRRHNGVVRTCDSAGFRTSKSEDHLQQVQREGMAAVIPIDIDEDVNSSLNTLLDTRQDSEDSQPTTKLNTEETKAKATQKSSSTGITSTPPSIITNVDSRPASASNSTSTSTSMSTVALKTVLMNSSSSPPESTLLSQRDIFNKRRRKIRIGIPRITFEESPLLKCPNDNNYITLTTITPITTTTATDTTTCTQILTTTTATTTANYAVEAFAKKDSNRDRIVWTYNAPLAPHQIAQLQQQQQHQYSSNQCGLNSSPNSHSHSHTHSHSHSHSSSISSSPQHSAGSPASPTSVSSSVMSSSGSKGALGIGGTYMTSNNGHHQQQSVQQQMVATNTNGGTTMSGTSATGTTALTMGLLQCPPSSVGGNGAIGGGGSVSGLAGGDHSVSEAISNISSPDYQDDDNLLSSRDLVGGMVLSDPSDSDSTILVSDAAAQRQRQQQQQQQQAQQHKIQMEQQHKLVIQVRGVDNSNSASPRSAYSELKDSEDELATQTEEPPNTMISCGGNGGDGGRDSSPPVSDDGSDVESLHSFHYSPKAVDMPSAIRLAKRLYSLDGFKKSDVSRHLSKNNDFSRAVADEYLKYFNFEKKTLDQSLREFLQQFSLTGETQERERVLVHFSKRFLDCNPGTFNSQDAAHTLTCAIMLLNTDLHGQNIGRKMTCAEFVENLAELNDGENFPKDILKYLYQAIKTHPLEWALDDEATELQKQRTENNAGQGVTGLVGANPFLDIPESSTAVEYKKGYVMRKCCYDSNYKKTPFGKRSWKMFYCTLRDLVLFLHKDEHGFRKSQMSDNLHNAIRIHHALATKATDYTKKQHVFRLQTADQAEYLFQTSDSKELQSWVETINFVCATFSAPPLEGGVGSQKRFQRPLLPSTHTKFLMKEQLESHEQQLAQLEAALNEHKKGPIPSKGLPLQNYKEKESYLQYELRRYRAYVTVLSPKLLADQQQLEMQQQQQITNSEELDTFAVGGSVIGGRQQQPPTFPQLQQPLGQSQLPPQQQQQTLQQPHTMQQQNSTNRYNYQQQDLG